MNQAFGVLQALQTGQWLDDLSQAPGLLGIPSVLQPLAARVKETSSQCKEQ